MVLSYSNIWGKIVKMRKRLTNIVFRLMSASEKKVGGGLRFGRAHGAFKVLGKALVLKLGVVMTGCALLIYPYIFYKILFYLTKTKLKRTK